MNAHSKTLFAEPNFAKHADHQCDVSENWAEEGGNDEAEVIAYFEQVDEFYQLTGLYVNEVSLIATWHDRQDAIKLLSPETVRRIEDAETEALPCSEADHVRQETHGWEQV